MSTSGRLVVLSGPSCVGKSPLVKALAQFHPDLREKLQALLLEGLEGEGEPLTDSFWDEFKARLAERQARQENCDGKGSHPSASRKARPQLETATYLRVGRFHLRA